MRLLAKICPELNLTLCLCLVFLPLSPFTASKLPHANTHQCSVYLTAQGQIHTCVQKKHTHTPAGFPGGGQLPAPGWPLAARVRVGPKQDIRAILITAEALAFVTPSSSALSADKRGAVHRAEWTLALTCVTQCPLTRSAGGETGSFLIRAALSLTFFTQSYKLRVWS